MKTRLERLVLRLDESRLARAFREGLPRLNWHRVLWRHAELLSTYGVPETEARKAAGSWCGNLQLGTTRPTTGTFPPRPGRWAYIHCSEAATRKLAAEFPGKNLVVTGHIASDSLGINPFLSELSKRGVEVLPLDVVAGG
ncbi:TPA: hypothetical protein DCL37_09380 [Candidatus Acetothermia bacterium]|nr:hypothetical protein [Candidatus Acetothermia bacterium]